MTCWAVKLWALEGADDTVLIVRASQLGWIQLPRTSASRDGRIDEHAPTPTNLDGDLLAYSLALAYALALTTGTCSCQLGFADCISTAHLPRWSLLLTVCCALARLRSD